MKKIVFYLLILALAYLTALAFLLVGLPQVLTPYKVGLTCAAIGGLGGCVYCLRGVYLNACVHKRWDNDWQAWYYIRPIISGACGGISFLFLKAGLLVLESGTRDDASELGFYALAFVAGLNVDKFIKKIEDVAEAVWGIEKSRTAQSSGKKE